MPSFESSEFQCAVDTIKNLRNILGRDPIDTLTPEEQTDWYNALKIINTNKKDKSPEDTNNIKKTVSPKQLKPLFLRQNGR